MSGPGTTNEPVPTPEDLERLAIEAEAAISRAADRAAWETLRVAWAGARSGRLKELQALVPKAPDKRAFGAAFNGLRLRIEAALAARDADLAQREAEARLRASRLDVTLPGRRPASGALHPVTLVSREIEAVFRSLGYSVAEGPEIEDDRYNFALLNFPDDHPARDAQDTLFVEDGRLLRTHTSPVQIRTMLARQPPIRVICPGRVYRNDNDLRQRDQGPPPAELFPVHRAVVRGRHHLPDLPRQGVRHLFFDRLDGDPRRRHGRPARPRQLRHRPGSLFGLRLRPRPGPRGDEQVRHPQHPLAVRERRTPPPSGARMSLSSTRSFCSRGLPAFFSVKGRKWNF
jgi:hypothetical protein